MQSSVVTKHVCPQGCICTIILHIYNTLSPHIPHTHPSLRIPVRLAARQLAWKETSSTDFDILWTDSSIPIERLASLKRYQRINHFPGMLELCRKAAMCRNLERMAQRFAHEYAFLPRTYQLPARLPHLLSALRKGGGDGTACTFIIKPSTGAQVGIAVTWVVYSVRNNVVLYNAVCRHHDQHHQHTHQGRGIKLLQTPEAVQELMRTIGTTPHVASAYISRPLLVHGYKFDMRLYVLLTSCDPLRVYLFEEVGHVIDEWVGVGVGVV